MFTNLFFSCNLFSCYKFHSTPSWLPGGWKLICLRIRVLHVIDLDLPLRLILGVWFCLLFDTGLGSETCLTNFLWCCRLYLSIPRQNFLLLICGHMLRFFCFDLFSNCRTVRHHPFGFGLCCCIVSSLQSLQLKSKLNYT